MPSLAQPCGTHLDPVRDQDAWLVKMATAGDRDTRHYLIAHYANSTAPSERDLARNLLRQWGMGQDR
ncbi:hypothetical protein [Chitinimonas lacunae]|uniref:Uncharacterized protein n=1 Tax=Chitinimonas lacunae TaxID=1963018 RepID=A0ABV8MRH8_9NEIS